MPDSVAVQGPFLENDRNPYYVGFYPSFVGNLVSLSTGGPADRLIEENTPPLTPTTAISYSSISSPAPPGFPWFLPTTTCEPVCSSPVPYVNSVRLRDLFSPEFRSRYYSSSESSSDESEDIELQYPTPNCDNNLPYTSTYDTADLSGSSTNDINNRDSPFIGEDSAERDGDLENSNETAVCELKFEHEIPYVRQAVSPIEEAIALPMILDAPVPFTLKKEPKLARTNKARNGRKSAASSSAHKDRPKAAPVRDLNEVKGDDYFGSEVHNGASYRSCEDIPFETIVQMPYYGERRPPRPFTHMIALALLSSPSTNHILSIEEIYQFISKRFPCFKLEANVKATKRWKSAVRHNLSFSSSFRKIATDSAPRKALPGGSKRCLWGFSLKSWEKQRLLRGHRGERQKKRK
ncbi:hypothetical protein V1509DRAFT_309778 [Lipomyces kononenkoae]